MTGGSDDARASDDGHNSVDAAWDELIGESEKDEDSGRPDARPVTGSHASAPRPDADDEMARLMAGDAPKLPPLSSESTRIVVEDVASAEPQTAVTPAGPEATSKADSAQSNAEGPARELSTHERVIEALERGSMATGEEPEAPKLPANARASRPSLRVLEHASTPGKRETEDHAVRASRPMETPVWASVEPAAPRGPLWGWPWAWIVLGAAAVGVIAYVATREPAPASSSRDPAAVAPAPERSPRDPVQAKAKAKANPSEPMGTEGSDSDTGSESGTADSGVEDEPKPPTSRKDPREPPPGTPPEIAAVFRRLPVGPADRPPVGGIGATGIHIDHIAMGTETQGATCRGRTDHFSVSGGDRAGVCVRVVHSREKEELQVLWQKHGGSTRRSKMVVLPMHAYRTRGYLVLRSEYIGDWTVRILSSDGVELARHDFTVDP